VRKTLLALLLSAPAFAASATDACLDQAAHGLDVAALPGQIVVATFDPAGGRETRVIAGADAGGAKLAGTEGFRIASITKTFVAATVLRLHEDGRIDLAAPITRYLPTAWTDLLASDGYRPADITVRHLLSHTSGLADAAQAPQFIETIKADPTTYWTRARDLADLVAWTDPMGKPGEKFSYSDTGYVLLGAIVERITGQDLPTAVREQLQLDRLGLADTWWERYESPKGRVRVHQLYEGLDTYAWDPSMDTYGGGGLVATPADLTVFFDALLAGRVFHKPETLALMQSAAGLPKDSPYRLGIFSYDMHGTTTWGHSGFWGTLVAREPVSGRTIAGAVTDRSAYKAMQDMVVRYVRGAASGSPTCEAPAPVAATH